MKFEPEICGVSIVLLGNFNPAIFNPDWFVQREIIDQDSYKRSEIGVIHPDVAIFSLGAMDLRIEKTKASFDTDSAPWVRIHDLVLKTFGEYLPQTPVTKFGINMHVHFQVENSTQKNKIGNILAPKDAWGDWSLYSMKERAGLISLTVRLTEVDDRKSGHVDVKVEPSARVGGGHTGVYVAVNDHYDLSEDGSEKNVVLACDLIAANFEKSLARSESLVDHVMRLSDA